MNLIEKVMEVKRYKNNGYKIRGYVDYYYLRNGDK